MEWCDDDGIKLLYTNTKTTQKEETKNEKVKPSSHDALGFCKKNTNTTHRRRL